MFLTSSEELSLVRSSPQSDAPYTRALSVLLFTGNVSVFVKESMDKKQTNKK